MEEQQNISTQGGRPPKYRKEFTAMAYQLALLGATDNQIAEALNITVSTLYEWKKKYKGLSEALRQGKIQADGKVAAALYKRATGFKYDEVTYERIEVGELPEALEGEPGEEAAIKQPVYRKRVVTKYVSPDTGAAMGWLKNRQKELWRDKQEIAIEFERLPDDQLNQLFEKVMNTAIKNTNEQ